jgi:glucan phosphoethanolaminetransferase (alkaline phosphatase superfamily)
LPAGYRHSATIWISPRFLHWVVPVVVVALFVLLFLPWTGAYPGGYRVYTQNAFQTIWGGASVDPVGAEALGHVKPYDTVEANQLMGAYALFVLLALVLALASLWLTPSRAEALPPAVRSLWRWRLQLLGAVALAAFVLLVIQLWIGFGLEEAAVAKVNRELAGELAAARTPEEHQKADIHRGLEMGPFNFRRTLWLHLAVCGHVLLLVGVGLELWLVRRGDRPLPRIKGYS